MLETKRDDVEKLTKENMIKTNETVEIKSEIEKQFDIIDKLGD